MNGELAAIDVQLPRRFEPELAFEREAQTDAAIAYAKRVQDWDTLEIAVDTKIADQQAFVVWWQATVSVRESPGRGGVESSADRRTIPMAEAERGARITHQQVSKWVKRLKDPEGYKRKLYGTCWKLAMGELVTDNQLVQSSVSNEHYTPAVYLEAAREVLGGIDLDPASCAAANKVVKATKFYSIKDDGLTKPWKGRVWLNPPYGGQSGAFVAKLMEELDAERTSAAILLVNATATDTAWFQPLWDGTLCFTNHRINFAGDGERSGSTFGSVFVYFGPAPEVFAERFQEFGTVVVRWTP